MRCSNYFAMHATPFPESNTEALHRKRKIITKNYFHVLSCLDTRKNQRKSRLKSPTRWVPRGWNCHAILFATPAAWLIWYRLLSPPQRSTPDPLPCQAFMPPHASSAPFPLREKGWGEVNFTIKEQRATYTNNFICHPERSEGSLIGPMRFFAYAQYDNNFTCNEQLTTLPAP